MIQNKNSALTRITYTNGFLL